MPRVRWARLQLPVGILSFYRHFLEYEHEGVGFFPVFYEMDFNTAHSEISDAVRFIHIDGRIHLHDRLIIAAQVCTSAD
jgi:hypothetical protein